MNWHYALNGQQQGPVTSEDLARLLASGSITSDTLIWREGMADWQPLSAAAPGITAGGAFDGPGKDLTIQQMREGVDLVSQGGFHFAGFWIRFAAKLIDGILIGVVNFAVNMLVFGSMAAQTVDPGTGEVDPAQMGLALSMMALNWGTQIVYVTFFLGKFGATLGKMAVGIRVVTAEGGKISYLRAFARELSEILSGLILLIGYIIAAFDSEKRALHDHICSTRVIYKR